MARLRVARGAAHFLRETVGRVRYAGARGQLTVRADSGFYAHSVIRPRKMDVRFSKPSASTKACVRLPEDAWTPYWMEGRRCGRDHLYPLPE